MGVTLCCLTADKKLPCAQPQLLLIIGHAVFLSIYLFLTNRVPAAHLAGIGSLASSCPLPAENRGWGKSHPENAVTVNI